VLVALTRRAAGGSDAFDADRLPDHLVRRHGLAGIAGHLGVARFRGDLAAAAVRAPLLAAVAAEARAALGDVPAAPIKGIAYATTIYDHPGERPMIDVDLLVPPDRFDEACRRLARAGLRAVPAPPRHHAVTFTGGAAELDLHRSIVPPGWAAVDLDGVWQRIRPGDPPRLDDVDQALFQLLVMSRNFWGRLIEHVDAARLLGRLDPDGQATLLERARDWRVRRAATAALRLLERVTGIAPPPGTRPAHFPLPSVERIARGGRPPGAARVLHRLGLCDRPGEVAGQLIYYAARTGWQRRRGA